MSPPQEVVRVKVEGDPPNTQGILKVTGLIKYDDDDVMEIELWGPDATFWERYDDELGFVVRSLKPSKESAYIGEERVYRRFGKPVPAAPFKVNEINTMLKSGLSSMAIIWDPSYMQDKGLAATLTFPGIFVTHLPGMAAPKPGDLGCVDSASSGKVNTAFYIMGFWVPVVLTALSKTTPSDMSDIVDLNAAATIGCVWRIKAEKQGGYSKKYVAIPDAKVATATYNRDPLEDATSHPRIRAYPLTEPQRYVTIESDEHREWFFSMEAILDFKNCLRSFEVFRMLNKHATVMYVTNEALRQQGPSALGMRGTGNDAFSTLAKAMLVQAVASFVSGIEAATKGTKVSKQGVAVHLKDFKRGLEQIATLFKLPGLMQAPFDLVSGYRDKVVDAELAKLRKEYTPTFDIEGEQAGPSRADVLDGPGRMRKQAGVKEESPTKADAADAYPSGKKPANRRTTSLSASIDAAMPDSTTSTTASTTSSRSSSTPASAAGISPTPLAQAAAASLAGTPKSAPDRPYAELLDKLAAMDTKMTTTLDATTLKVQLDSAMQKIGELEAKVARIEREAQDAAAASTRRIEELTESAHRTSATAAERERVIQYMHQQQATTWHAFLASTGNSNSTPQPITPFPAAPAQ